MILVMLETKTLVKEITSSMELMVLILFN